MEAPRVLKSFLIVISLLAFFMVMNILASVSYLYRIINVNPMHVSVTASQLHHVTVSSKTVNTKPSSPRTVNPKPTSVRDVGLGLTVRGDAMMHRNKTESSTPTPEPNSKPKPKADPLARPDACTDCFVHNFKYLLQNKNICNTSANGTIDLLMVILTVHAHVKQRNNIRATWTSIAKGDKANVRYAFLLGKTSDKALMESIGAESKEHNDILMEDFVDSYSNLTYKTIMGMKWATLFCPQAKFLMKTDDDMWVNVPALLNLLTKRGAELQNSVGGACSARAGPIRDHRSKWYASVRSYPHSSYPGFCSGTGYVTSLNMARKIYEVSANIPFFHLEDVYVALCIKKLGMKLLSLPGFHSWITNLKPCEMRSSSIITSHGVPTDFLLEIMKAKC